MPTITEQMLKGNAGECFVAETLSRTCLVRPVASGTDIGVDLFCESVRNGEPFMHFWVQVKSINEKIWSSLKDWKAAKSRLKLEDHHVQYWLEQPAPVCLIIPKILKAGNDGFCFDDHVHCFFPLIEERVRKEALILPEHFTRQTLNLRRAEDVKKLLQKILPELEALMMLRKGILTPVRPTDTQYETKFIPLGDSGVLTKYSAL